jgi:CubicO group peptidase (beta-lactamase class C family)
MTWMQSLPVLCADGIVVLHRGAIVYERYCGVLEPLKPHSAFSVTKSFVGTLATMLAAEGVIDPAAPVTRYLPEMKNTAYGDATVRQVMDMTIGVKFSEDYSDPNAEAFAYARAGGMMPRSPGLSGPTEPLRVPGHGAEAGEPRRGLRISDRQYRGAGVDPHAHHGPDAGATHVGADLVEAWGGARCLLHRGRHRHRMGRRRPRTDRGSRQR